jgi:hypothetical protein
VDVPPEAPLPPELPGGAFVPGPPALGGPDDEPPRELVELEPAEFEPAELEPAELEPAEPVELEPVEPTVDEPPLAQGLGAEDDRADGAELLPPPDGACAMTGPVAANATLANKRLATRSCFKM